MQQFDRRANTAAALSCRGFEAQATGTGNDDEMAAPNRAPKPRSGRPRSNERAAIYQRRQEEHALGSFNVQMDAACDASAMADSLQKSLAELSIDSPLRNHANFATISAKAWEGSPGSQDTALATMFFDAQGPRPTYADFAKSAPQENPFTRATAQGVEVEWGPSRSAC